MEKDSVPQDKARTYEGHKRLLYATDKKGNYSGVQSSGWEVEEFATNTAVDEFNRLTREAHDKACRGECSPLMYHMYCQRMDVALLAQCSGIFQWRIKRHLKNQHFKKLKPSLLTRYADALGINVDTLTTLPEKSQR